MKQEITIAVKVTIDYDNREVLEMLREQMVETGRTADQVRKDIRDEVFKNIDQLVKDELGTPIEGATYTVEDISV